MLSKIVYFDEGSVTDYVQIIQGGNLVKTSELLKESSTRKGIGARAKASVGIGGVLKALIGFNASLSAEGHAEKTFDTDKIAKSIITNTILTDFIDLIKNDSSNDKKRETSSDSIKEFKNYTITVPKDSLSYVALISPYLSMFKGDSLIPAGEFEIAVEKLDNTIKNAKGYYEFVGENNNNKVIFRFNIESFKNNYKATDLTKMNIVIYAIKVGTSRVSQLNVNNEFAIDNDNTTIDNPEYKSNEKIVNVHSCDDEVDVYDVLLAGVESDDK